MDEAHSQECTVTDSNGVCIVPGMRERKRLRACPDNCGKFVYDLGNYRGFKLVQEPFFSGYMICADKIEKDEIDMLLLAENVHPARICEDTETIAKVPLQDVERYVIKSVDSFWQNKLDIVDQVKKGTLKMGGSSK